MILILLYQFGKKYVNQLSITMSRQMQHEEYNKLNTAREVAFKSPHS
jgi:hypothetical protein